MNKIIISGHLGKDPELRQVNDETSVCNFTVAVKGYKDDVEWARVSCWNATAVNCKKYLERGSKVLVEGRMQTRSYDKDGVTRYVTEVIANNVEFLDSAKSRSDKHESMQGHVQAAKDEGSDIPF